MVVCRYLDIEEPQVAVGVDMIVENDQLVIVAAAWQIPTPRHKAWGSKAVVKAKIMYMNTTHKQQ